MCMALPARLQVMTSTSRPIPSRRSFLNTSHYFQSEPPQPYAPFFRDQVDIRLNILQSYSNTFRIVLGVPDVRDLQILRRNLRLEMKLKQNSATEKLWG
jgi:hypothetical protein